MSPKITKNPLKVHSPDLEDKKECYPSGKKEANTVKELHSSPGRGFPANGGITQIKRDIPDPGKAPFSKFDHEESTVVQLAKPMQKAPRPKGQRTLSKSVVLPVLDWLEFRGVSEFAHNVHMRTEVLDTMEVDPADIDGIYQRFKKEGYEFIRQVSGAGRFRHRYDVYGSGRRKVAEVYMSPYNPNLNGMSTASIEFKIANSELYSNWLATACWVIELLSIEEVKVKRMDLALDMYGVLEFFDKREERNLKMVGREKPVVPYEAYNEYRSEGFQIGRKGGQKYVRGYQKTRELDQNYPNGEKNYIRDWWKRNGLDGEAVERLEVQMRKKEIDRIKDFDWKKMNKSDYIAGIIKASFRNWLEFYEDRGQKRKVQSESDKIHIVDWSKIGTPEHIEYSRRERKEQGLAKMRSEKTRFIRYVIRDFCLSGDLDTWELAWKCAKKYGLTQWLRGRLMYKKEWFEDIPKIHQNAISELSFYQKGLRPEKIEFAA